VLAFLGVVFLGGINGTAIKITNLELGPFWGATLRFGLASLIFFALVLVRRVPLPRGRRLAGSMLYGLLAFGMTFALVSWALVTAPAGIAQIVLALVPLLTLGFAAAVGLERLRLQNVAGAVIALGGIILVFADQIGSSVPIPQLLALVLAAASLSAGNVVVKRFPRSEPTANNAVGMGTGALLLLALAAVFGDSFVVPRLTETWLALGYLVIVGSVVVFTLFLYVIARWTASATSYSMLLMPLVAVVVAAVRFGEPITLPVIGGGALVMAGVYIGAFAPTLARPLPGLFKRAPRTHNAPAGPPVLQSPNCP